MNDIQYDTEKYPFHTLNKTTGFISSQEIAETLTEFNYGLNYITIVGEFYDAEFGSSSDETKEKRSTRDSSTLKQISLMIRQGMNLKSIYKTIQEDSDDWHELICIEAKNNSWPILSLQSNKPIKEPNQHFCVQLDNVINWLADSKSTLLSNTLNNKKNITLKGKIKSHQKTVSNPDKAPMIKISNNHLNGEKIENSQKRVSIDFDNLSDDAFLQIKEIAKSIIPFSESTIRRKMAIGEFPSSIELSNSIKGWRVKDLREWLRNKYSNA